MRRPVALGYTTLHHGAVRETLTQIWPSLLQCGQFMANTIRTTMSGVGGVASFLEETREKFHGIEFKKKLKL